MLDSLPKFQDQDILKSYIKGFNIINNYGYKNILCSISGGSDSDIVLDIISRIDVDKKVKYIWFDTGLEYQATKDHLKYLEEKYDIIIERERAIKPIPLSCKEYGQPFLSKQVSCMIDMLQRNNFKWEDRPLDELLEEYPKCKSAIRWWCNARDTKDFGYSIFNINYNKFLKDFLIQNPPTFKIAAKCCKYAKKDVSKAIAKKYNADLMIIGVRKAEGGIRSTIYKSCFSRNDDTIDQYRPIFWYKNETKEYYEKIFNIQHSKCYTQYGFIRTGCCCCPYGSKSLEHELDVVKEYEPLLYKAVNKVFKDTYEYTRQYREFCEVKKQENKMQQEQLKGQMYITDFIQGV